MGTPDANKVHWVVRLNYRNRSISFMLLFAVLALHLLEHQASTVIWSLLAFQLLIYPHLLYLLVLRSSDRFRAETHAMLLDSLLFGCWVVVLGFPLWVTFTMLLSVQVNLTAFYGLRGLFKCIAVTLCGVIIGVLFIGIQLGPESNRATTLAIIVLFSLYLLMVSHGSYLRNRSLRAAREQLRQSEHELQNKLTQIHTLQVQLRELANRDALTGLHNRRFFDSEIAMALNGQRTVDSLCLLIIDIDHFKRINDQFGHQAGDHVLARLAGILTSHCRPSDVVCRYGGEEFAILMPDISIANAGKRAERIRQAFANMPVSFDGQQLKLSLSIGIAAYPAHAIATELLIGRADQALYRAKAAGRNRVLTYEQENAPTEAPIQIRS